MRETASDNDRNALPASTHAASFRAVVQQLSEYEPGKDMEELAAEYGIPVDQIVKLASNECPFGPSPAAVAAIPTEFPNLHLYPWKRFTDFKEAIAARYGVTADNVVLGSGSGALVTLVPHLYVEPGDQVIVAAEGYPLHSFASLALAADLVRVPLRDYRYDVAALLAAVTARTKLIWICSPINPTGTIVRKAEMRALLAGLPPTVAVVMDGAYAEFVDDPEYADGIELVREGYPNVIALRTLSKAYGLAGLRAGYLIASAEICAMLNRLHEPFDMSRPATAAGPVALADTEWLRRCQEFNRRGRQYLTAELTALGLAVVPSEANFVLVDVGTDERALYHQLLAHGVIIRPTDGFGYPRHIRVTVGTDDQNRRFVAALTRVLAGPAG